ncbi:acyl carrier protein [Streptacidiphilus sp. MAP12-33]|uniref:acyl carrier protein n=1 Tax=Streptacidiphilus sp. MAP12-33 TaxID=3156266 RepID=UPI00351376B3
MTDIQQRLNGLLTAKLGLVADDLRPEATLEELDLDSLALIELSVLIQKEFGVLVDDTALTPEATLGTILDLLTPAEVH